MHMPSLLLAAHCSSHGPWSSAAERMRCIDRHGMPAEGDRMRCNVSRHWLDQRPATIYFRLIGRRLEAVEPLTRHMHESDTTSVHAQLAGPGTFRAAVQPTHGVGCRAKSSSPRWRVPGAAPAIPGRRRCRKDVAQESAVQRRQQRRQPPQAPRRCSAAGGALAVALRRRCAGHERAARARDGGWVASR